MLPPTIWRTLVEGIDLAAEDLRTPTRRDASRPSRAQAVLSAHAVAMVSHRAAHVAQLSGFGLLAHAIAFVPRVLVGVDIHPSATIGRRVFLDHGQGIVIGESAAVGDDVVLHHGVTLGATWSGLAEGPERRRHPVIGDRVRIGCRASVLGAVTIGDAATIDAGCVVHNDLAPGDRVRATSAPEREADRWTA